MENVSRPRVVLSVLALVLLIGGLLTYFIFLSPKGYLAREHADIKVMTEGDTVSYIDLEGTPTNLESYRGEILIMNVWASWSPYTLADHTVLERLKATYGDRITILALDRKEPRETAEAYLSQIGKKEGIEYVIDETDHLFASVGGYAMPETIVFDEIGNITLHVRGVLKEEEIRAEVERLLAE